MEIYNIDYNLYVQDGEHEPKQMTNFTRTILWRVHRTTSRHTWVSS